MLFALFFFSLQSCGGGGGDGGYITIDIVQQNETDKPSDSQDDNQNNENDDKNEQEGEGGENHEEGEGGNHEGNVSEENNNPVTSTPITTTPNDNLNASKAYLYIDEFSRDGIGHQSAACYGDYAFFISNKMIDVMVYNMRTNQRIYTLKQDPLGTGAIYHCNQACFGTQKYSEEDPFPLLYISQFQNKKQQCFITVFRVLPTSAGIDQEYTAFALECIQTIYLPIATDDNCFLYANTIIDTDNNYLYTYSHNNNPNLENHLTCKISKFNIPNPLESNSVYLSDSHILDSFFIPVSGVNMQGGAYQNGLIFIGRGSPAAGYVYLYVVDLASKRLWYTVDLLNNGFSWEPEGVFFYKDDLYIGASSRIFKFTFKYENSSAKAIAIPLEIPE